MANAIGALSLAATGFASGKPFAENLSWTAIGLVLALAIGVVASSLAYEMDGGEI